MLRESGLASLERHKKAGRLSFEYLVQHSNLHLPTQRPSSSKNPVRRKLWVSEKNSSRNCLINSWRALSTLVLSDTRRPNRAPSHRSTPWWDPRIGPVSIYQTVSLGSSLIKHFGDPRLIKAAA